MNCDQTCAVFEALDKQGLPRVEGACKLLDMAVNTSEVVARTLYEVIDLQRSTSDRLQESEDIILKLIHEKEQLRSELTKVSSDYMKMKSEYNNVMQVLKKYNNIDKTLSELGNNKHEDIIH